MPVYRSIVQYRKVVQKRLKALKKESNNTSLTTAKIMINIARVLAPRKTGETSANIKKRKTKKGYTVESWVSPKGLKGFRQNMWANLTPPHNMPRMRWNAGKPTRYGDGSHMITGTPGFFSIAASKVRKQFGRLARKNTLKALRVST